MGMFDNIYCERKLPLTKEIKKAFPNTDWTKEDFQTKDLDNTMTSYYIKKNGYLYTEKVEGEYVRTMSEEEENKIRKQSKFCWPHKFVETSRELVKETITETINFYSYEDDDKGNTWDIEFDAEIVKGKVKSIKLVKGEIAITAEKNAEAEKAWQDRLDAYERHPWTRTKKILNKITFGYWSRFWGNKVSRALYWVAQKMQKLRLWVIRTLA
jgi:hypothetical protein